ncbi:TlpA family protein disulfide reductase [Pinibacter aurantiacus]|uniref:Redoxin domain-containing protein n=1 Tax=Pinibacter aurantiacus TaxID=2851599 RepID=A0A9E2S7Y2_9BACT|nr:redoxin domain-containing protein [Pinibacter aurantiacus]MBV4357282.1 redoxin domain-containing protein [Pinibacter aurantiacus]
MKNNILIFCITGCISLFAGIKSTAQTPPADTSYVGLFNALKSEPDASKKEFLLNIMKTKPRQKNTQLLLDASSQYIAVAYAEAGNADKAIYYRNQIVDSNWRNGMTTSIVHYLLDLNKLKDVEQILEPIVNPTNSRDTTAKQLSTQEIGWLSCQYGILKYKQGKFKESLPLLAPSSERQIRDGAELYVLALIKTNDKELALKEADSLLSKGNKVSEDFKAAVEPIFVSSYGNSAHYQSLLDSIDVKYERQIAQKISKGKIYEPAPYFEIKDTKGKTVSLNSLKGKTVVIDFWATWCIPCIASFPGMQKAVNYYKNDTSVVFMFVHTWEKGNVGTAEAQKLIDSKGYNFNVYMDLKDKESDKNPLSEAFKLLALPTKVVIDKDGIIRFKSRGGTREEDVLPEIKAMIELSK